MSTVQNPIRIRAGSKIKQEGDREKRDNSTRTAELLQEPPRAKQRFVSQEKIVYKNKTTHQSCASAAETHT